MVNWKDIQGWLWLLQPAAFLCVWLSLRVNRLSRSLPVFSFYLLFTVLRSIALVRSPVLAFLTPSIRGWIYVTTEPIDWILSFLVVYELYTLVFQDRAGLLTASRYAFLILLVLASGISLVSLGVDLSTSPDRYPVIALLTTMGRAVSFSLVLVLVLLTGLLSWFPIRITPYLVVHLLITALYFSGTVLGLFLRNMLGPSGQPWVEGSILLTNLLCAACWMVCLRPAEAKPETVPNWIITDADQVTGHLDAINRGLQRMLRRS